MKFKQYYKKKNSELTRRKVLGDNKLVVALCSFPPRIHVAHIPIQRMLDNDVQPDLIALYLSKAEFPNMVEDLPNELQTLAKNEPRFKIRFVENDTLSHKRNVAMHDYPEDFILVVDDDIYYRKNLIRKTLARAAVHPGTIVAGRMRQIKMKGDYPALYKKWKVTTFLNWCSRGGGNRPLFKNFRTGVGGIFYPPRSVHTDVYNEELLMRLCPKNDDIWMWANQVRMGTKTVPTGPSWYTRAIAGTRKSGQARYNLKNNTSGRTLNDDNLDIVLKEFPEVLEALREESRKG